jgi:hypothetical protein
MLIESVVLSGFAVVVALLIAIALEIREARKSFDSLRSILADAVGTPLPDLLDARTAEPGSVIIPKTYEDLIHVDDGEDVQTQS